MNVTNFFGIGCILLCAADYLVRRRFDKGNGFKYGVLVGISVVAVEILVCAVADICVIRAASVKSRTQRKLSPVNVEQVAAVEHKSVTGIMERLYKSSVSVHVVLDDRLFHIKLYSSSTSDKVAVVLHIAEDVVYIHFQRSFKLRFKAVAVFGFDSVRRY